MEFQPQKKLVAKYGKKNRVVGVNFFDDRPKPEGATSAPTQKKYPISPSSAGEQSGKEDAPISKTELMSRLSSPSPVLRPAHVTAHSISSLSKSRSPSPVKQDLKASTEASSATFDIISSDDEQEMVSQRPLKKRKLTQTLKQQKARPVKAKINLKKLSVEPEVRRQALMNKAENVLESKTEVKQNTRHQKQKEKSVDASQIAKSDAILMPAPILASKPLKPEEKPCAKKAIAITKSIKSEKPPAAEVQCLHESEPAEPSPPGRSKSRTKLKRTSGRAKPNQTLSRFNELDVKDVEMDIDEPEKAPLPKKRTYVKTKVAPDETPKRRRQFSPARSETSAASPGSRLFSELRLSPSKSPLPSNSRETSLSPIQSPVRRGRLRRIDLLDAPAESTSQSSTRAPSLQRNLSPVRIVHQGVSEAKADDLPTGRPTLTRSNSSQTRLTYGKARNTYGKERSYLADMVDDLEALSYDSSQEASQRFASQLAANSSGPSQLQMELELDTSSSDDGVAPLKLKSIHELRQAGSNDRFSRDLEGLLLDIDPTALGATKPLRIEACVKLFAKLSHEAFATFILDQGLDRLVEWSRRIDDKVSQVLLNMIFWRLVHVKGASPVRIRSILQAVAASTSLITDFGIFASLIKDPKENLSKSLIRELVKFESETIVSETLPAYEGEDIVPAAIVLATIHDALQRLVQASLSTVLMGEQSIKKIVHILTQVTQQTRNKTEQDRFITKTVLSLLKLFSGPLESDLGLNAKECIVLGNTLGVIINTAVKGKHEDMLQSVLHFAVSLCNDKPIVCRNITKSGFVGSVVTLSSDRFSSLVQAADGGKDIDTTMLDSIILSLASLLNITEYDDAVRIELSHQALVSSASINLKMLVQTYVQVAPQANAAMTAEKIQLQVAFGWLSLLICNLCLEASIWTETQQLLVQAGLDISDVVASAKELLLHLRTVEMGSRQVSEDESTIALDGFTLRFGTILDAVKIA